MKLSRKSGCPPPAYGSVSAAKKFHAEPFCKPLVPPAGLRIGFRNRPLIRLVRRPSRCLTGERGSGRGRVRLDAEGDSYTTRRVVGEALQRGMCLHEGRDVMTEYEDTSLTGELRVALDTYLEARAEWRELAERMAGESEDRGRSVSQADPSDERYLHRAARTFGEADFLGDVPDEVARVARRYLVEFGRLSDVVEVMRRALKDISGEEDVPEGR